ncbi:MAG: hypothetical protein HY587_06510 [Candidatus Omnitrophica bacterium]|nr:hypothetical protein [Candidatus Omnitrophota bacterium]
MNYVFIGLAIANTILLLLTAGTGYLQMGQILPEHFHILAGLFVTLFTCFVHSIIFIYFLGTGKSIKTACDEYKIEGDFVRMTRKLKGRSFPFALFGSLAMMAAAFTGGAAATEAVSPNGHHVTVLAAMGWNILCFVYEYKAVCENTFLLERLAAVLPPAAQT